MQSLGEGYRAAVLGASGGIGRAIAQLLESDSNCARVYRLSRRGEIAFDLTDEASLAQAAERVRRETTSLSLIFNATGVLDRHGYLPEKSLSMMEAQAMNDSFAINATGPALILKHFHTLLPRSGKSVLAFLSARVGSIGDNRIGGWYSYRASKAALNQIVRTGAIEIARKRKDCVCVALHPGTVATGLSKPYAGSRPVQAPLESAEQMLQVIDGLDASQSGRFFAFDGKMVEW